GPVLVAMSFRNPSEAVALANNTPYGLAASVWSENINLALDVARRIKAGSVWINSTNLFDAASSFGGYRESGYGREGGKEGLYEYVKRTAAATTGRRSRGGAASGMVDANGHHADADPAFSLLGVSKQGFSPAAADGLPPIDRTPKLLIG